MSHLRKFLPEVVGARGGRMYYVFDKIRRNSEEET